MNDELIDFLVDLGFEMNREGESIHFYPYTTDGKKIADVLKSLGFHFSFEQKENDSSITEIRTWKRDRDIFVHESFYTTQGNENDFSTDVVTYWRSPG